MIRRLLLVFCVAASLVGCATSTPKAPPICAGRHLRPANPYGSVLQPAALDGVAPTAPAKPGPRAKPNLNGDGRDGATPGGCGT